MAKPEVNPCLTCDTILCLRRGIEAIEEDAIVRTANDPNAEREIGHMGGDAADALFAFEALSIQRLRTDSELPEYAEGARRIEAATTAMATIKEKCTGPRQKRTWYTLFLGETTVCGYDPRLATAVYNDIFPTYYDEVTYGRGVKEARIIFER